MPSPNGPSVSTDALVFVDEVRSAGRIEELTREQGRVSTVERERKRLGHEVSRLTAAKRDLPRSELFGQQILDERRIVRHVLLPAHVLEDVREVGGRRILREDLVLDAA